MSISRPLLASASLVAGAIIWGFRLGAGGSYWAPSSGALIGANLILLAAVAVVGVLVGSARWAQRTGIAIGVLAALTGIAGDIDVWWWIGLGASALAVLGLSGNWFKGVVKERPSATGPPWQAVALTLLLAGGPAAIAVGAPSGVGAVELAAAAICAGTAFLYMKAGPLALLAVRVLAPVSLAAAGLAVGWPGGVTSWLAALGTVALAWTPQARVAVRPLVATGTSMKIPPELTPREILEAAGIDDRGRRRPRQ